jgi:two-component system sensor histidine kinase/response regulator
MARVLIVDDNQANRDLAEATLGDEGYETVAVASGPEALGLFAQQTIDCVLLDVRMPGMDGFEVCEKLRALPGGTAVPVIFLTALRDVDTFDKALRAGGDDFLTKPVRPTELVVRVQSALKLRELRAEVQEHFSLLKHQRDDLMRLQLQKERLMAFIVHDLKSPVHSMDLLAQALLEEDDASPMSKLWAGQIRSSARQLDRMIRNLLDVARGEEGALEPARAEVDLRTLAEAIFADLAVVADLSRVRLIARIEVDAVSADGELLRRALTNLVENAVRHAPKNSEVELSAQARDGGVELRVADQGKGVPESLRPRIFEAFVAGADEDRPASRRGFGLGLSFCKLVAEAHHGSISIDDSEKGAVFVIRLPGA